MNKKRIVLLLLSVCMMLQSLSVSTQLVYADNDPNPEIQGIVAKTSWDINGTTIPIYRYSNGSASYGASQCWAFAQMVYTKIWGIKFT